MTRARKEQRINDAEHGTYFMRSLLGFGTGVRSRLLAAVPLAIRTNVVLVVIDPAIGDHLAMSPSQ